MNYDWSLASPAIRQLEKLPEKVATAIVESFDSIAKNPQRMGKPLKFHLQGLWAARRGPYRVIYKIDEDERSITIVAVAHRSSSYR